MGHPSLGLAVVFDLLENGFRWGGIAASVTLGAALSVAIAFAPSWAPRGKVKHPPWVWGGAAAIFFAGITLMGAFEASNQWSEYRGLKSAYTRHQYDVVEGPIADFDRVYDGHGVESFTVAGRKFAYSPSSSSPAFRGESGLHLMRNGVWARVYAVGDEIVRIEVQR